MFNDQPAMMSVPALSGIEDEEFSLDSPLVETTLENAPVERKNKSMSKARLIAFYLPQFHPIPENDEWWGEGFTEWTNVRKAKPLFKGHYQPHLPGELGYYDLRKPEVREAQAQMARNAGIEAFCYYHYWFAGRRLLERPFNEVLASRKPDFPFCLCWANHTWTGVWYGAPNRILIEQTYPGAEDNRKHFEALKEAFKDPRYLQVDGRPVFVIYAPKELPNPGEFIRQWRQLAAQNGMPGIYFIAHLVNVESDWDYRLHGFDSCVIVGTHKFSTLSMWELAFSSPNGHASHPPSVPYLAAARDPFRGAMRHGIWRRYRALQGKFFNMNHYRHIRPFLLDDCKEDAFPCVIPNWDNTPRSDVRGSVLHESTPELFRLHLRQALDLVQNRRPDERLVFVKSWNEWAEGNYLEPDQRYGHAYLDVVRDEVKAAATESVNT
jgi:hypothetical protein